MDKKLFFLVEISKDLSKRRRVSEPSESYEAIQKIANDIYQHNPLDGIYREIGNSVEDPGCVDTEEWVAY